MSQGNLKGMRVAILVADDFEQVEMTEPRQELERAGAQTILVSPVQGQVHGMKHDVKLDTFKVDLPLDQARPEDFDALLLPGGALNADALRVDPLAQQFARALDREGKPIAVICHGPWLLVSAGLARGRRLTSYHTIQDDLRNAGAQWVDEEEVRDSNWVSSRQPSDLPAFNRAMIRLFSEHQAGKARKAA